MRTMLLAAVLFYASYGFVMIGHNAGVFDAGQPVFEAISRQVRALGRQASSLFDVEREPEPVVEDEPAPSIEREAAFSKIRVIANRAFP